MFTPQTLPPEPDGLRPEVAESSGSSLLAGIAAKASQRDKLEHLARYVSMPPVATDCELCPLIEKLDEAGVWHRLPMRPTLRIGCPGRLHAATAVAHSVGSPQTMTFRQCAIPTGVTAHLVAIQSPWRAIEKDRLRQPRRGYIPCSDTAYAAAEKRQYGATYKSQPASS